MRWNLPAASRLESDTPAKRVAWGVGPPQRRLGQRFRRRALRVLGITSERSTCSLRCFLLADVVATLLPFEPGRGHRVPAGPEMLAREVPLFRAQPGDP